MWLQGKVLSSDAVSEANTIHALSSHDIGTFSSRELLLKKDHPLISQPRSQGPLSISRSSK